MTSVDVSGCTSNPCQLKKGTNATVKISYTLSKLCVRIEYDIESTSYACTLAANGGENYN